MVLGQAIEVGFSGDVATQPADGVFDAPLLPGAVGIAEEGANTEACGEHVVVGELGAVVDGECPVHGGRQGSEPFRELAADVGGGFVGLSGDEDVARLSLVGDERDLAIG